MSFFPSLPADAGVRHILTLNPEAGRALVAFHTAALRNAGPLEPAHKELIAAYVSGLNACQYCYGVHSQTAQAFGLGAGVLEALLADVDTADVEERLKPLLHYARKLTLEPTRMMEQDAQAVFAAGWSEAALHDAVLTVCLFNFMNRLLEGHGVKGNPGVFSTRGQALRDEGYEPLLAFLDAAGKPGAQE
ncbi:MAG: peroxidase [Betaproteobacteria bacterium HGW-Betaproteobacteria-16]|nr:MAG: peroxidase [Betaproteobacteria bacterium HGW-Betaproteobacteria-16]